MKLQRHYPRQIQRLHENPELTITLESAQGVWERSYLEADGNLDTTTQVTWMQAGQLHVDLRLAREFLQLPAVSLHQQTPEALMEIARVTAFAGVTDITDNQCTWTRQINYQGPLVEPDVGVLSWSGKTLIEKGVYSSYEEGWLLVADEPGRGCILEDSSGSLLFLCVLGEHFGLGRANPVAMQQQGTLADNVSTALEISDEASLLQLFDQEFCFGRIMKGYGVISASSMPSRAGSRVFRLLDSVEDVTAIDVLQQDFLGQSFVKTYRRVKSFGPMSPKMLQ